MSFSQNALTDPFLLLPLDQQQALREEYRRNLGNLIPGVAAGVTALASPDRRLADESTQSWLPYIANRIPAAGAVEGTLGTLGFLYDKFAQGTNYVLDKTGIGAHLGQLGAPTHLPASIPVLDTAGEHLATTAGNIAQDIPHASDDPAYAPATNFGIGLGFALPIAPGGPLRALGTTGKVLRHIVPTTEGAIPNLAIGGAVSGAGAVQEAEAAEKHPLSAVDQTLNPPTAQPTPPAQKQEEQPVPGMLGSDVGTALNAPTSPPSPSPVPDFAQEGESNWTVGEVVGGLVAFAALLYGAKRFHAIGTEVTTAARDARMNDPTFTQKATDFNNEQIAAKAGTQISQNPGGAITPPPAVRETGVQGPVHAAAVAAQTNVLDGNAWVRDYANLTAVNPPSANKLANQVGLTLNDMSWQSRLRAFLTTGVDDQTGLKMPIPKRLFDDIDGLPPQQKDVLNNGLMAANELDNRKLNYTRGRTGTDARYDFPGQSDQDLARLVVDMQRDPVLKEIQQRYQQSVSRIISIGEARGFFTAREARDIRGAHPNYVPDVDINGRIVHAMGERPIANQGVQQVNTNAWTALAQHHEELYRQYELAEMRRAVVDHQLDVQRNFPNSPQWLEPVRNFGHNQGPSLYATTGELGGPREPIIAIRRNTGIEHYRVLHPEAYDLLAGNNATKFRAIMDMASVPRRMLQSGTTGTLSLLSGRMFPAVNMARTAVSLPMNRTPGTAGGLVDLATQRLTGGRFGYRGFDPTNFLGAAYSGARSGVDDLALHLSYVFDKTNPEWSTQLIKSIVSPQRMDMIRDALQKYYTGTVTHEMRARGVGGMGTPFRARPPALRQRSEISQLPVRLISGELTPRLFMSGGRLGTIKPYIIRLQSALNEIFSSISDASHEYYYRLNRFKGGLDPYTLTHETRAITGDPGVAGSGKVVGGIRAAVPYANISAQGLARRGRAFKETPFATTLGLVSGLGSLALLSLHTAMQNDQTRDYLQNVISTQGREANVFIFGNPDPHLAQVFSLDQELRAPYAMLLDIASKLLMTDLHGHDLMTHDGALGFLKDWFSHHIENSTWSAASHGLGEALNLVDVPPFVNALMAGGGTTMRFDLDRIMNDFRYGKLGLNTFYMPVGADSPLPNHPPGDNALEGQDAHKYSAMFSNAFGMFGTVWDNAVGFYRYYNKDVAQTHDPMHAFYTALGQVKEDFVQRMQDLNPQVNSMVWNNQARDSMRPPIVEKVTRTLDMMKQTAGATSAERMEGTTGGPRPLQITPQEGPGRVPTEPTMRNMYFATNAEYNWISSRVMTDINALKKQSADLAMQGGDVEQRRKTINENTRAIADKYRYIQSRIDDLNAAFSRQVGAPVDVGHIDWTKGPEQFRN